MKAKSHPQIPAGSVWVAIKCHGKDIVEYSIVSSSQHSMKYKIAYDGNPTPNAVRITDTEIFLSLFKQKECISTKK